MKKILPLLFSIILICGPGYAQSKKKEITYRSGEIVDIKGNRTKISKISSETVFNGVHNGQRVSVSISRLKKVEKLSNNTYRLTNLAGEAYQVELGDPNGGWHSCGEECFNFKFTYFFYDKINMQEKQLYFNHDPSRWQLITFGTEGGRLRYNPRTKMFFPEDYIYDPYTREELIWKSPEK